MLTEFDEHIDQVFSLIGREKAFHDRLVEAKKEYIQLAGSFDDTSDEYEGRLQNFNEWFLFDYIPAKGSSPFVVEYLRMHPEIDEDLRVALTNVQYSLFEYGVKKFSSKVVLKDLLKNKKYYMLPENFKAALVPDEIFTGRVTTYKGETFLLSGIRHLPRQIRPVIYKQAKAIRKLGNPSAEYDFVLQLEKLKTKWLQYRHIDPLQIFVF